MARRCAALLLAAAAAADGDRPLSAALAELEQLSRSLLDRAAAATAPLPARALATDMPTAPARGSVLRIQRAPPGSADVPGRTGPADPPVPWPAPLLSADTPRERLFAPTAPFSAQCAEVLARGEFRVAVTSTGGAERRAPATTLDIGAGTAGVVFALSDALGCLRLAIPDDVNSDYYLEGFLAKREAGKPRRGRLPTCAGALRDMVAGLFGPPPESEADVWLRKYGLPEGADGAVLLLASRPGWAGEASMGVDFPFELCVRGEGNARPVLPGGGDVPWPKLRLELRKPPPAVGVGGDIMRSATDALVRDGGAVATFTLPAGWAWRRGAATTQAIRSTLEDALGPTAPGQPDVASADGPSERLAVLLGPRPSAAAMTGRSVMRLRALPSSVAQPPGDNASVGTLPFADPLSIDDVTPPYASLEPAGAMQEATFRRGGTRFVLRLGASGGWAEDSERRLRDALSESFGPPAANCQDNVSVVSRWAAEVALGCRVSAAFRADARFAVLPLTIPSAAIRMPGPNATARCVIDPLRANCSQHAAQRPLTATPALVVRREGSPLRHRWAVIGGGVSGLNALGRLLDNGERGESILWIDSAPDGGAAFQVGRMSGYRAVLSTQNCWQFSSFLDDFRCFREADISSTSAPLSSASANRRHCRLGDFVEPMLAVSRHLRVQVVSLAARLRGLQKVRAGDDFVWRLDVEGAAHWVTQGVVLAVGGESRGIGPLPAPAVSLSVALHSGVLRATLNQRFRARAANGTLRAAVFGTGPTAFIVLHGLALLPEIATVTHIYKRGIRSEYIHAPAYTLGGRRAEITRLVYGDAAASQRASEADFVVVAAGWKVPDVSGVPSVLPPTGGVLVEPKLFSVGIGSAGGGDRFKVTVVTSLKALTAQHQYCKTPKSQDCFEGRPDTLPRDWAPG